MEACKVCGKQYLNCLHCPLSEGENLEFHYYHEVLTNMADCYSDSFKGPIPAIKSVLQNVLGVENAQSDIYIDAMVSRLLAFTLMMYKIEETLALEAHEKQAIICNLMVFHGAFKNWFQVPEAVAIYMFQNRETSSNCPTTVRMAQFNDRFCQLFNLALDLDLKNDEIHFVATLLVLDNQLQPVPIVERVYATLQFYERTYMNDVGLVRYQNILDVCTKVKQLVQYMGTSILMSPLIQGYNIFPIQHNNMQVLGSVLFQLPATIV